MFKLSHKQGSTFFSSPLVIYMVSPSSNFFEASGLSGVVMTLVSGLLCDLGLGI